MIFSYINPPANPPSLHRPWPPCSQGTRIFWWSPVMPATSPCGSFMEVARCQWCSRPWCLNLRKCVRKLCFPRKQTKNRAQRKHTYNILYHIISFYIYIYVCKYRQDNIITLCMWISSFTNSVSYDFLCLYTCAYGHTYVDTVYVLGSPPSLRYFGCYALGGPPTALGRRRGRSRTAGPAGPWSRFWLHVTHIDILMRCIMYNV